jgi:hypothetical protein
MPRATIKQRYFVASQEIVDGKTVLVLLEEGKDTAACHNTMKGKEFAGKHTGLNLPVRVCILRDEPAYMVQAKPNELAQEIRESHPESADQILGTMAKHGVDIAGEMEVSEVDLQVSVHQPPAQGPQDAPGPSPEPTPAPEASAPPPEPMAAPQAPPQAPQEPTAPPPEPVKEVQYLDQLRIVPSNYQTLGHEKLLEIAMKIDQSIDGTCTKLACMAVIGKYLETGQRNVAGAAPAPTPEPQAPPGAEAPVDHSEVPPAEGFVQETCTPGQCGCIVWKGPNGSLFDAVEGYPEHDCPAYIQSKAEAQSTAAPPTPPPPPGPPAGAAPPPPPPAQVEPPPAVAPSGGFTQGGSTSGEAPPQGDVGVPPGPPPPPPPPPPPAPQ